METNNLKVRWYLLSTTLQTKIYNNSHLINGLYFNFSNTVPRRSGSMIGRNSLMCSKRSRAYYWLEDNRDFSS